MSAIGDNGLDNSPLVVCVERIGLTNKELTML